MRLFPLLVLAILASSLLPFSTMNAYALNCESTQTGFWDVSSTWTGCGDGVPGDGDNVTIKNGHTVTIRTDLATDRFDGLSLTIEASAELVIDGSQGGAMEIAVGIFTNFGKMTIDGEGTTGLDRNTLRLSATPGTNECGGTIDLIGGDLVGSGRLVVSNEIFVNKGTINLIGGGGSQAGTLGIAGVDGQVDNHGTINENPGAGPDSGIVLTFVGTFNDNLPNLCPIIPVGGELLPIDTTALLLAGAQSFSWMIPVVLSGIGIGLFVVSRKSE